MSTDPTPTSRAAEDEGPECDLCGKTTCPDADLPEFSEPRACAYRTVYVALRRDRCEYGCGRDVTKESIRRDLIPAIERMNIADAGLLREQEPAQGGLTEAEELAAAKAIRHERQMRWEGPVHEGECITDARAAIYAFLAARGGTAAAGDEGLRARIEALADEIDRHDRTPECSDDNGWRCRECVTAMAIRVELDATPAPTEAPAPSQDTLRAAAYRVDSIHHFNGETCLCGFSSGRSRSRTEHITGALLAALAATTPEATGQDGEPTS